MTVKHISTLKIKINEGWFSSSKSDKSFSIKKAPNYKLFTADRPEPDLEFGHCSICLPPVISPVLLLHCFRNFSSNVFVLLEKIKSGNTVFLFFSFFFGVGMYPH